MHEINKNYENFYATKNHRKLYPTEFVVRTFLAKYPALRFDKPKPGAKVLDLGFGDGRNTIFLCDQDYEVSGVEITPGICDMAAEMISKYNHSADLRVGRNVDIPFQNEYFDYILACNSCYYCDVGKTFNDNMNEIVRVTKPGGWLVASLPMKSCYIFRGAQEMGDGSMLIQSDPYGNRVGYRLHAFDSIADIEQLMSKWFTDFSFGSEKNNYYGIEVEMYWVTCKRT